MRALKASIVVLLIVLFALPVDMAVSQNLIFQDSFEAIDPCVDAKPVACNIPEIHFHRVSINEVSLRSISRGITDAAGTPPPFPWIELYNDANGSFDLSDLSLKSVSQGIDMALPAATFSQGDHFTIWFMPSATTKADFGLVDDLDLSDGEGRAYLFAGGVPDPDGDDLGLFRTGVIESFFAYGNAFASTSTLETTAVAANRWRSGDRFDLAANSTAGESPGLVIDGFYPGQAPAMPDLSPDKGDFVAVPWVEQTAGGIQQPEQAIQVWPQNGQMLTGLPVTLRWRACEGASGYLLALFDSDAPAASPILRVTGAPTYTVIAGDISANPIYWTVACMYQGNTRRSIFPPRWLFATGAAGGPGPGVPELAVGHEYQRKDTNMLCLYDAEFGNAYGCDEVIAGPDGACNWDAPHNVASAAAVHACGPITENYCVRASIKMVHELLVSNKPISQDYISFLGHASRNPPGVAIASDPEGDLGAGAGMTVAQTVDVLSKVLDVSSASITVRNNPKFSDIRGWIDADRPVILFRWWKTKGGHASVVFGYQLTPFNGLFVHDPTAGPRLVMRYSQYSSTNLRSINPLTAIVPPASAGASPIGDPPNSLHPDVNASVFSDVPDFDGVVNFDEIYRFSTAINNPDSDFDQVGEKEEVFSYTFAQGKHTIVGRPPDIDTDSKRAELDCSTDALGNNDHDGGEDIDGDGGRGEGLTGIGPGETDVFKAGDGIRALVLNKQEFFPGEEVRLMGGTLHGSYSYAVTTLPCPMIPDNTPIGGGAAFNTNALGNGDNIIATCTAPGCFISYVDIADEGVWQETSQKCDTALPWTCVCDTFDPPFDIIDVPSGLAIPFPPPIFDIVDLRNGTTMGFEVELTMILQGPPAPANLFSQFVFQLDPLLGAPPLPFPWAEGGNLLVEVDFLNLTGPPIIQAQVWDPNTNQWVEDTQLPASIQATLQPAGPGEIAIELVMPGTLDLPGLPPAMTVQSVRPLTGEQSLTPQAIDVLPEPSAVSPAVYDQFIDLGSCNPRL